MASSESEDEYHDELENAVRESTPDFHRMFAMLASAIGGHGGLNNRWTSDEDDDEESETDDEEEEEFQERYELFVGNLPNDIDSDDLTTVLNSQIGRSPLPAGRVSVQDLIRPIRGRPFAFVRCNNEAGFNLLLDGNGINMNGRNLRIARSRRIRQESESSGGYQTPEASNGGDAPSRNATQDSESYYKIMREGALQELANLDNKFQSKFDQTQKRIRDIRGKINAKEKEKARLETDLTKCGSELASLHVQLRDEEKSFNDFTQEHSTEIDHVRERIRSLRSENSGGQDPFNLPETLRQDLDCICCYETMGLNGALIYQCTQGHLICPRCHRQLQQCPLCRESYTRPPIRSRMSERLAATLSAENSNQ